MFAYLEREARGFELIVFIAAALVLDFFYLFFLSEFLKIVHINFTSTPIGINPDLNAFFLFWFFGWLFFQAFLEECIFRLIPLSIVIGAGCKFRAVVFTAILSSVIFGLVHGNVYCIFFQGFGGLIYCFLFMKCGGLQKKYGRALLVTTITHFLYNGICVVYYLITLSWG